MEFLSTRPILDLLSSAGHSGRACGLALVRGVVIGPSGTSVCFIATVSLGDIPCHAEATVRALAERIGPANEFRRLPRRCTRPARSAGRMSPAGPGSRVTLSLAGGVSPGPPGPGRMCWMTPPWPVSSGCTATRPTTWRYSRTRPTGGRRARVLLLPAGRVAAYEKLIAELRELNRKVLAVTAELSRGTIETVLATSDLQLGAEALLRRPRIAGTGSPGLGAGVAAAR